MATASRPPGSCSAAAARGRLLVDFDGLGPDGDACLPLAESYGCQVRGRPRRCTSGGSSGVGSYGSRSGMVAKVRPCLVLSVPVGPQDRALATMGGHTTSTRGSQFEVVVQV